MTLRLLDLCTHQPGDLTGLGVAPKSLFAKDERFVDLYFETPATGRKQGQAGDIT